MHRFTYKVSLRIFHSSMDPDEICTTLRLKPSVKWKIGSQRVAPNGKLLKGVYDKTYCSFELSHSEGTELLDFLKKCSDRFMPFKDFFHQIDETGGEIEYFIGWFSDNNSGEVFDLPLLEKLVELRVKLSIDFYGNKIASAESRG